LITSKLSFTELKWNSIITFLFIFSTPVLAQSTDQVVFYETFPGNGFPSGWKVIQERPYEWEVSGEQSRDGYALNFTDTSPGDTTNINAWAFTSEMKLYPGATYTVSFYQKASWNGSAVFNLLINSVQDYNGATTITPETFMTRTGWVQRSYTFTVNQEGNYYIGFGIKESKPKINISIDQVRVTTPAVKDFYNKNLTDLTSLNSWRANQDGSGTAPLNFTDAGQVFHITNYEANSTAQLTADWAVTGEGSKVVLGNGSTPITLLLSDAESLEVESLEQFMVDVADHATLSLDASRCPTFGQLSPLSTIVLGSNGPAEIAEGTEFGTVLLNSAITHRLIGNIKITGKLKLQNAKLELGDYDLELGYDAVVVNGTGSDYLVINGKGRVRQGIRAGSSEIVLPVGNATYNPVKITLSAGSQDDVFSVGVTDGVYGSYTTDVPVPGTELKSQAVNKTWFISEDVEGGSDISLTLSWSLSDTLPGFNAANCHIKHYENGGWDEAVSTSAAASSTTFSMSRSGITSFSPFTVSSRETMTTPLPVELLYFAAKATIGNTVDLTWATAMEKDSDFFAIERSTDGWSFTHIGLVQSAGVTSTRTDYSFTDHNPVDNTAYYRLRQVDLDGSFELMPVRAVSLELDQSSAMALYPNPVQQGDVHLRVQGVITRGEETNLQVTDMMGRSVMQQRLQEGSAVLKTGGLRAGTYLVSIVSKTGTLTQKLVVL
jgi:hypothetical protein